MHSRRYASFCAILTLSIEAMLSPSSIHFGRYNSEQFLSTQKEDKPNLSLFERLANRKSSQALRGPLATYREKFESPKVVRALSDRQRHMTEDDLGAVYGKSRPEPENAPPKQKQKQLLYGARKEDIERIFKANEIKRKISYDMLLDNYKVHAFTNTAANTPTTAAQTTPKAKVFADGKFIGYFHFPPTRRATNCLNFFAVFRLGGRKNDNLKK